MTGQVLPIDTAQAYKITDLLLATGYKVQEDKWYRLIYTKDNADTFIKEKIPKKHAYVYRITRINNNTKQETIYTKKMETKSLIKELKENLT